MNGRWAYNWVQILAHNYRFMLAMFIGLTLAVMSGYVLGWSELTRLFSIGSTGVGVGVCEFGGNGVGGDEGHGFGENRLVIVWLEFVCTVDAGWFISMVTPYLT